MKIKTFSLDFFYTVCAQLVLNATQHLIVFPLINKVSGPEITGRIFACLSIVYIFSNSFGIGMSNTRLAEDRNKIGTNGDYLCIMGILSVFLICVAIFIKFFCFDPQVNIIWFILLLILYMIRVSCVYIFLQKLQFFQYFIYFLIISIGYGIGVLIYEKTGNWTHIFILGEILSIIMLFAKKNFWIPYSPSDKFIYLFKAVVFLSLSAMLGQLVVSGDRLILKYFINDRAVTVYSSLSLAAKMGNLGVFPLGTLLLGYLMSQTIPSTREWFYKISSLWIGFCLVVLMGTLIVAPIYVKIFFNNIYNEIEGLNIIVNIGLVMAMVGYLFKIYLIVFSSSSLVFTFELIFTIIHLIAAIFLTNKYGMIGYAWAVIIGRGSRMITGAILSFIYINMVDKSFSR